MYYYNIYEIFPKKYFDQSENSIHITVEKYTNQGDAYVYMPALFFLN